MRIMKVEEYIFSSGLKKRVSCTERLPSLWVRSTSVCLDEVVEHSQHREENFLSRVAGV